MEDLAVQLVMQMTLAHDKLIFRDIPPRRPSYQEFMGDFSQQVAPLIDPGGVRTLGELGTMQRVLGRIKEEGDILPISVLPTLTKYLALREDVSGMDDGTIMVQGDHSMALENQKILPHREEYSTYGRGWWPLMHTLAKLRKFWMGDNFP